MITNESVFLITEGWIIPGMFEEFKKYRIKVLDILKKYEPEFVFFSHAFEPVFGDDEEPLPTGMEVLGFDNEATARAAIAELSALEVKDEEQKVFSRVRSYLSRAAPPEHLKKEMNWW